MKMTMGNSHLKGLNYHCFLSLAGIFIIYRVRTGPGNPEKSLNLKNKNPDLESAGIF